MWRREGTAKLDQRGKAGWEDGAAAGSHNQVLVTVRLSGSCQLQLASWYIIQVPLCTAISALPPSSLSTSTLHHLYSNQFLLCLLLLISKLSIWSFFLSALWSSSEAACSESVKSEDTASLEQASFWKTLFYAREISFSNRQTCFMSLNNRLWVPIWQLIKLIRAKAHLRGTDADGATLETTLAWARRSGSGGTRVVRNCYYTSSEFNQGLRPAA